MNASFEEKSVLIQLIGTVVSLGLYFVVAGLMFAGGINTLPAYVPVFTAAVVLIVVINAVGHIVVVRAGRREGRDERDRLIGWRAESRSLWILAAGVILAIMCLIMSIGNVWIAHLLLLSLFVAEVVKNVFQLVYYRRGI